MEATVELMAEIGIDRVRTRAIAERAGVNPALVHYHFGSIAALAMEAAEYALLQKLGSSIDVFVSAATVQEGITAMLEWIEQRGSGRPAQRSSPKRWSRQHEIQHFGAGRSKHPGGSGQSSSSDSRSHVPTTRSTPRWTSKRRLFYSRRRSTDFCSTTWSTPGSTSDRLPSRLPRCWEPRARILAETRRYETAVTRTPA